MQNIEHKWFSVIRNNRDLIEDSQIFHQENIFTDRVFNDLVRLFRDNIKTNKRKKKMKEKPLCGYCYNECTDECCDKRSIDVLERQLEEARRESDYLTRGIQVRDKMIKGLQEECVKLHLQLPIKPFTIQLKEQG